MWKSNREKAEGGDGMKRVYLSGPITGMSNHNREAFARAAEVLRKMPNVETVVNPHDIVRDGNPTEVLF